MKGEVGQRDAFETEGTELREEMKSAGRERGCSYASPLKRQLPAFKTKNNAPMSSWDQGQKNWEVFSMSSLNIPVSLETSDKGKLYFSMC